MRQKKRNVKQKAVRLLAALGLAAVVACLLASGKAPGTVAATDEAVILPTERPAEVHTAVVETEPAVDETVVETVDEAEPPAPTAEPEAPAETEPPAPEPDEAEVEMLACGIYCEAGGDACSDLCRYMVGDAMLNRVGDPRFPDTLEEVLTQKGQYGRFYWTGIVWPERASNPGEAAAVARAYETARALLSGEHSELYGEGYIWQAEFAQGTDVIYLDGIYFGR